MTLCFGGTSMKHDDADKEKIPKELEPKTSPADERQEEKSESKDVEDLQSPTSVEDEVFSNEDNSTEIQKESPEQETDSPETDSPTTKSADEQDEEKRWMTSSTDSLEIDFSVEEVSEELLTERTAGLLVAEDETEEELLFQEEAWIPPLTRWTKLRRYFAKFSMIRGILIIIFLLMSSFTSVTYITGQSINGKLNQGLQEINQGLDFLQARNYQEASFSFKIAEEYFRDARYQAEIYRFSLLLNLPVTITSFILFPEVIQGANNLPLLTDGMIGICQAYRGLGSSLDVLENPTINPYSILLTSSNSTILTNVEQARNVLAELINYIFQAESQKERYLSQLEKDISLSLSGYLNAFYQTFSQVAKQLDDLLALYRIGFEVTMDFLNEVQIAIEIINHLHSKNWVVARQLTLELRNMNEKIQFGLQRMNSEVVNVDSSWYRIPLGSALMSLNTWINVSLTLIDDQKDNSANMLMNILLNQVLYELKPIAELFSSIKSNEMIITFIR